MSDLQKLLSMLFLKSAPQALPYSTQLTLQMIIAYMVSGYIVLQTTLNPDDTFPGLLLGIFVQFSFTYVVLHALNRTSRFLQTLLAIVGVSALFNIISWPVLLVLADDAIDVGLKSTMSLAFLMVISWEVLVKAYIFKHALEIKMLSALLLSFSLLFISIALSQLVFSAQVAG